MVETFEKWICLRALKWVTKGQGLFTFHVLLERLGQVEALLHIVVTWTLGVNVSDAAVTSVYSAVLLQSLGKREEQRSRDVIERKTLSTRNINHPLCH